MLAMCVAVSVVVSGGHHEQEEGFAVVVGGQGMRGPFLTVVDGNMVPSGLCCSGKAIVRGDSRECSIAAASILAKCTAPKAIGLSVSVFQVFGCENCELE